MKTKKWTEVFYQVLIKRPTSSRFVYFSQWYDYDRAKENIAYVKDKIRLYGRYDGHKVAPKGSKFKITKVTRKHEIKDIEEECK